MLQIAVCSQGRAQVLRVGVVHSLLDFSGCKCNAPIAPVPMATLLGYEEIQIFRECPLFLVQKKSLAPFKLIGT